MGTLNIIRKYSLALKLGITLCFALAAWLAIPSRADAYGVTAANNTGPTANSAIYNPSSNNTTVTPFYDVGDTGDYPFSILYVSAFVDDSVTGTITFTIQNGNAECHGYTSAGVVGPDYSTGGLPPWIDVSAEGGQTKKFDNNPCTPDMTITAPVSAANTHPGFNDFYTNRYKKSIWLDISMFGGQGENSFRIKAASNCPKGDGKCVVIAVDPAAEDTVGLGFRASPSGCTGCTGNINNGNHWDGEIMFAPNATCADINKNSLAGSIGIADPDGNNSAWNPNLIIKIQHQKLDNNGNPTGGWGDVGLQFGPNNWWPDSDHTVHWLASNTQFPLGWRYRIVSLNVGVRNTIKFKFGKNISQIAAADYWSVNKCYGFKCTNLSYTPTILNPGDNVTVSITVKNTGALGWTAGQQLMKRQPGYHSVPLTVDVAPGGSTTIKNTFTVQYTDTYTYSMYINSTTVMPNTGPGQWCPITIPVGTTPPPTPYLAVQSCSSATIQNINSANIKATYTSSLTPITKVPVELVVKDSNGNAIYNYVVSGGVTKDSGTYTVDMADLWSKANMFPHNDYQLQLVVQGTKAENSLTYTNNGAWSTGGVTYYTAQAFNTALVQDCWQADCSGDYTTATDAEPGENVDVQVGFNIVNKSPRAFNNVSYYNALPAAYPGASTSSGPVAMNIPALFSGTIPAKFTIKLDYTGSYSAVLRFATTALTDVCQSPDITPATRPFFQVWNGNAFTGGSFLDSSNQCPATMPDYVSPSTTGDSNYGGIKAYSNLTTGHGSAVDFGALALGLIANKPSDFVGLIAHNTFANSGSFPPDSIGGYLDSTSAAHCVTDFYDSTQNNPQSLGAAPSTTSDMSGSSTSQYSWDAPIENFDGGTVNSGQHIVLYVNGDVTIDGNITFGSWSRDNPSTAPFFAMIVRGSITLTNDVTRLDGLYVAEPDAPGSTSGGNFDTCDNFCNNQLLVNGSVIAQSVHLLRSFGTLDPSSSISGAGKPAEIFNYLPSMLLGVQYLNPSHNNVQTLISLPPAL